MRRGFGFGPAMARRHGATGAAPVNLMISDSEIMSSWGGNAIPWIPGQADPFGGSTAYLASSSGAQAWYQAISAATPIDFGQITLSTYVRNGSTPAGANALRMRNSTISGPLIESLVTFTSPTTPGSAISSVTAGGFDSASYESVGSGWFRVWVVYTVPPAEIGDNFEIRPMPWRSATAAGAGCALFGYQINPGSVPDTYVRVIG